MPVLVKKYRCQFKCGFRATDVVKHVLDHEAVCWNNPENKTCKSCRYEKYGNDGDGFREWKERACKHPEGDKISEEMYEALKIDDMHIKPVTNCPFWENKSK